MIQIKISLLPQQVSWNINFDLDTATSMTPRLFFVYFLLEHINFSRIAAFPLNNVPNMKSFSMQKKRRVLHWKKTHIDVAHKGYLRDNHLRPSSGVSVDNFESQLKGHTYISFVSSTS